MKLVKSVERIDQKVGLDYLFFVTRCKTFFLVRSFFIKRVGCVPKMQEV